MSDPRGIIIVAYLAVGVAMFIYTYSDPAPREDFTSWPKVKQLMGALFFLFCWPLLLVETDGE